MRKSGSRQEQIAEVLGITQGTVSKELSRNRGKRGYRAKQANNMAAQRQLLKRHRSPVIVSQLRERIDMLLRAKHSSDQISGALKLEGVNISHESIYFSSTRSKTTDFQSVSFQHLRNYQKRPSCANGLPHQLSCCLQYRISHHLGDEVSLQNTWRSHIPSPS